MVKSLRAVLAAAVTTAGILSASSGAHAVVVLNGWNLNLSVSGVAGATDLTNIDHIILTGNSTVTQTVVGGSALGQPFTDSGFFQMSVYRKEASVINTSVVTGAAAALIFQFTGLTGTLLGNGNIVFNPGVGTIKLFLDNGDATFGGGDTSLADFKIIAPSGGSNLDFFGGTAANSTVDVTLEQTGGLAGLFTDSANNPLSLTTTLHLGNVDALLDPNFSPNPDNSGIDGLGNGESIIRVQNAGQYNVAFPEPGTLALLGLGMVGLGLIHRRRKAA